jgi:hypothetical protein
MLHDAASIRTFADFPWLLSPAAAMFLVVFGLNLVLQDRTPGWGPGNLRDERPLPSPRVRIGREDLRVHRVVR